MTYKPKLIEVALPLSVINKFAAAEGSIGQRPHPKNLHRWWARRPLSAARAVIFASLVDDPSSDDSLSTAEQETERLRLFSLIERMVAVDDVDDREVMEEAFVEIARCMGEIPTVADPFGGGGAIPLEAQRLGLRSLSGDLNPVAVLIQKAMLEIPAVFEGRPPVKGAGAHDLDSWVRAQGMAADVEFYGRLVRQRAEERVGHVYPRPSRSEGEAVVPLVWIWARTIESPDPTWRGHVPLVASWRLSSRKGRPPIFIEPSIDTTVQEVSYRVVEGGEPSTDRTVDGGHGVCLATGAAISGDYIKAESKAGRLGVHLMAIVAQGPQGRMFLTAEASDAAAAFQLEPEWRPKGKNPEKLTGGTVFAYGLDEWWKIFTSRQLVSLTTLSEELREVRSLVERDAISSGMSTDPARLRDGGSGAAAYADAITTYLAFTLDKMADFSNSLCTWNQSNAQLRYLFSKQSVAMSWDFAEVNPFSKGMSSWDAQLDVVVRSLRDCLGVPGGRGVVNQRDAKATLRESAEKVIVSTDPPYYANMNYADLSDFFYVWLRENLGEIWPDECATLLTPKASELIANRWRAGSKQAAEEHFESGMANFMESVAEVQDPRAPATIYYAYKAVESIDGSIRSTGWDTFLQGVIDAGMRVTATWPLRTERQGRTVAIGKNALASSILLACRPNGPDAPMASRGEFVAALRSELPEAVRVLQTGNIAPVDFPQSTIGPGIGVFSRYSKVIESDGSSMSVAAALGIINDVLGEVLDGEEAEMDKDSRFALAWYSQYGFAEGSSGDAISLAQAKNTSLEGVGDAGIGVTRGGGFRLHRREELPEGWTFLSDKRPTVWETTQYLIAALERSESEAAALLHSLGGYGERARQLSYLLFKKATDKGWAGEAGSYNSLIAAWPSLRATSAAVQATTKAPELDFEARGEN